MDIQFDQPKASPTGHSSTVRMSLIIGDIRFPVLQSSKDAIKLKDPHAVPSGDAILETTVDERLHRRLIRVGAAHEWPNWVYVTDR